MSGINERAIERLENLDNIEPLLASLRILSLSTLQMAQNRIENLRLYKNEYERALAKFVTSLPKKDAAQLFQREIKSEINELVVLGSERGICGKFNKNLAAKADEWVRTHTAPYKITAFGSRLQEDLKQAGLKFLFLGSLSQGSKPRFDMAEKFIFSRLLDHEQGKISNLFILSFRRNKASTAKTAFTYLIPTQIELPKENLSEWPPTIIEGDGRSMAERTMQYLTVLNFYELILESIMAENDIRYNLLEEAKENVKEMMEALTIEVQMMKRQKITQQIQEIAVGAAPILK